MTRRHGMASDPQDPKQRAAHYAHCESVLRESDRDGWLACLFAPPPARAHLHAIHAFALDVAGVRTKVSQPILGEMRLRWWADAIEAGGVSEAGAGARAHPIADALLDTIERFSLPRHEFVALLDAHGFDLYDDPMPTMAELEAYCRATTARPMAWAAQILGAEAAGPAARALEDAGVALGLVKVLRALPRQAAAGQCFIPADALARHGAAPQEIRARLGSEGVRAALGDIRAAARGRFERARAAAGEMRLGREALLPASIVPLFLARMERRDYDPFRTRVDPPAWRRQWRLWRAARGVGL